MKISHSNVSSLFLCKGPCLAEIVTQLHVAVIVSVTLVSQSWSWVADDVRAAELHVTMWVHVQSCLVA